MLSDGRSKRKIRPNDKWTFGTAFLCIFGCLFSVWLLYMVTGRIHSSIPLFNNLSSYHDIETVLLEQLPLGTSYDEVQEFIEDSLYPSRNCLREENHDFACTQVSGTVFFCKDVLWTIYFSFRDERLTDISVEQHIRCDG